MEPLTSIPIKRIREIKALFFDLDGTFVGKDALRSEAYNYLEKLNNIRTDSYDALMGVNQ